MEMGSDTKKKNKSRRDDREQNKKSKYTETPIKIFVTNVM